MNREALINAIVYQEINPTFTAAEAEAHLALFGLAQVWAERDRERRWRKLLKAALAPGGAGGQGLTNVVRTIALQSTAAQPLIQS